MGFGFVSCEEGDHNVSNTLHFEIVDGEEYISAIGNDYVEPGVYVTYKGENISSEVTISGEVDGHTIGVYNVHYTLAIDGINIERDRTVYVCDPTVTTDISGKYTVAEGSHGIARDGNDYEISGYKVTISKIAPGFFAIDKLLGGFDLEFWYGNNYAFLAYNANIQLTTENEIKLVAMTQAYWDDGYGVSTEIIEGNFNPENNEIYLETAVPRSASSLRSIYITLTKND